LFINHSFLITKIYRKITGENGENLYAITTIPLDKRKAKHVLGPSGDYKELDCEITGDCKLLDLLMTESITTNKAIFFGTDPFQTLEYVKLMEAMNLQNSSM
jgi:hypothetical protein